LFALLYTIIEATSVPPFSIAKVATLLPTNVNEQTIEQFDFDTVTVNMHIKHGNRQHLNNRAETSSTNNGTITWFIIYSQLLSLRNEHVQFVERFDCERDEHRRSLIGAFQT
jgi:hypothetical protein